MNEPSLITLPAAVGDPYEGGFYAGCIRAGQQTFALIAAPHAAEIVEVRWHKSIKRVAGAGSFFDGRANTEAMAAAGSPLAVKILALEIAGFADWYLPSRDELELLYRGFKPTGEPNWCFRGDNPSSVPAGYAYQKTIPPQTAIEAFRPGGAEAFADERYWSSTQYAGNEDCAWAQDFGLGYQGGSHEGLELRARPVRRLTI